MEADISHLFAATGRNSTADFDDYMGVLMQPINLVTCSGSVPRRWSVRVESFSYHWLVHTASEIVLISSAPPMRVVKAKTSLRLSLNRFEWG
jgi:hypothetical protein